MWNLTVHIKKNDEIGDKRLPTLILDLLLNAHIAGATVWTGVNGFGKRGSSTLHLEGEPVNMPLIIEVIDEQEQLEPLLVDLKRIVGDNGLVSISEVYIL